MASVSEKSKANEIKLTRVYDAPVKAVWEAWTDPKQVAQWWGPRGFTLTTHSKDLRAGGKEKFFISRSFETSVETMYQLWTDPKHFAQWLPPTGLTMEFLRSDIRVGGSSFYRMTDGAALVMYGRCHYLELLRPNRLVYTQEFTDSRENISRHPGAPTWPASMMTTVTLEEEESGVTRVTVEWEPHGKTTREEIAAFVEARAGMTQGWTGSFDKLEKLI
jgi:uncharacterized protein YndB with AHSA1/START domain